MSVDQNKFLAPMEVNKIQIKFCKFHPPALRFLLLHYFIYSDRMEVHLFPTLSTEDIKFWILYTWNIITKRAYGEFIFILFLKTKNGPMVFALTYAAFRPPYHI